MAGDALLQPQATVDAGYFMATCGRSFDDEQSRAIRAGVLHAYRWQYILSGARHTRFREVMGSLLTESQVARIERSFATIL